LISVLIGGPVFQTLIMKCACSSTIFVPNFITATIVSVFIVGSNCKNSDVTCISITLYNNIVNHDSCHHIEEHSIGLGHRCLLDTSFLV
jgi:hypothetical protein